MLSGLKMNSAILLFETEIDSPAKIILKNEAVGPEEMKISETDEKSMFKLHEIHIL